MKRLIAVVAVAVLCAVPLFAQQKPLVGTKAGVKYTAAADGNATVVTLDVIKTGFSVTLRGDRARDRFSIRSNIALTQEDLDAFEALAKALPEDRTLANEALLTFLGTLLARGTGPGDDEPIVIESDGTDEAWTTRCKQINKVVLVQWDEDEKQYNKLQTVGPCGKEGCFGRCGNGCGAPPPGQIQRFTQECIDHDGCTRHSGKIFGPCLDEWKKAALGFNFAPDCEVMSAEWADDWNEFWDITEFNQFFLYGEIDTDLSGNKCGIYKFTGSRNQFDVEFRAERVDPWVWHCCQHFGMKGTSYCNEGSGTFSNPCGNAGYYNLYRLWQIPAEENATPWSVAPGAAPTAVK